MPNWCNNGLVLSHHNPAMIDRVIAGQKNLLQEFIPCPQDLTDTVSGSMGKDTPEQAALEAQQAANIKQHGFPTWYEWSIHHWGTKWDIGADTCDRIDANTVRLSFDSAWSPPIEAYSTLETLGFNVQAFYYEPGMAYCGIYENGVDNCIEYGGATSETVRELVGERLDDYFCISEQMADQEAENQE
jgi:hypothetical protein